MKLSPFTSTWFGILRIASTILACLVFLALVLPSCKKTVTVRDIKNDTTYIQDTTIIRVDTAYDLNADLLAYYNFNNGSLKDSSAYHHDILENTATPTADRFGHPGNAYLFNGSSSYMRATVGPDSYTIMAIVKFNDFYKGLGYGNDIITKGDFGFAKGLYALRAGPLSNDPPLDTATETFFGFIDDGGIPMVVDSSTFIRTGIWYIVVLTFDLSQMNLYVNGKLVASKMSTTDNDNYPDNDVYIGKCNQYFYPDYFNGVIDEIRIYRKTLSPSEVQAFNKLTL